MGARFFLHRVRIIGTQMIVLTAWEPSTLTGRHSTLTHREGLTLGRIGTDADRARFAHLPPSEERRAAYRAAHAERCALAYRLLRERFPEAWHGDADHGEICCRARETDPSYVNEWIEIEG